MRQSVRSHRTGVENSPATNNAGLRTRRRGAAILTVAVVALAATTLPAGSQSNASISPPPQPTTGRPGSNGPCVRTARMIQNASADSPTWVFEPHGSVRAPATGGMCDGSKRPTLVVVHGFGLSDPAAYLDMIDHNVSNGNIVVYPTYAIGDSDGDGDIDRTDLEASYRVVEHGVVAAVKDTSRIDISRIGWWGHSHGGGMIPWLVQQAAKRGWGRKALWMSNVAQAFTQLVGSDTIEVPRHTQSMTIAFADDAFADNRLGIDVFTSLTLAPANKHHVTISTDRHGDPSFVADHGAPLAFSGTANAVDFLLWRYGDLLERCALSGQACNADLSTIGRWSDGTPVARANVSRHPVDIGPAPAQLAECDAGYAIALNLNPRIDRCGSSRASDAG
jgi:hypothetical protein